MLLIGGIFLLIIGVFMLIAPDAVYAFIESWKNYSESEPSDLYKICVRFGGGVTVLVGIAGIVSFFVF